MKNAQTTNFELRELKIELTQECPLACIHCSTNSNRKRLNCLPREVVARILHEGFELGVERVSFTGGEPLVYHGLHEAIRCAHGHGIEVSLYTSGIKDNALHPLTQEDAQTLLASGVDRFIFSLYGTDARLHDSVTRYGTYDATVSALSSAVCAGARVEVHFVAMRRNFRQLLGLVANAAEWGVSRVSVLRFVPQGRGKTIAENEDLSRHEFEELAEIIRMGRLRFPSVTVRAGSPLNFLLIGNSRCNAAQDILVINHRGEVFPCDAFKNVQYPDSQFGSVLHMPIRTVWENSAFLNRVRSELAQGSGEARESCRFFSTCRSGCLAQKVIRDGYRAGRDFRASALNAMF